MMCLGKPQYFATLLKTILEAYFVVRPTVLGMNLAYFENLSTTTMIVPHPSDIVEQVIKSIVLLSY